MIYNHTQRNMVCQEVEVAFNFFSRFKGLMFKKKLQPTEGLLLAPCSSVHMFFMKFAIDVVFIDKNWRVVGLEVGLKPWRISKHYPTARYALELPAGRAGETGISEGDRFEFLSLAVAVS